MRPHHQSADTNIIKEEGDNGVRIDLICGDLVNAKQIYKDKLENKGYCWWKHESSRQAVPNGSNKRTPSFDLDTEKRTEEQLDSKQCNGKKLMKWEDREY